MLGRRAARRAFVLMRPPFAALAAQFKLMRQLTEDPALIVEAVKDSPHCTVDDTKTMIKPNIKVKLAAVPATSTCRCLHWHVAQAKRNTIILRELPADTKQEELEALLNSDECGKVRTSLPRVAGARARARAWPVMHPSLRL